MFLREKSLISKHKQLFWPRQLQESLLTQSCSQRLLKPLERFHGVILRSLFILDGGVVFVERGEKRDGALAVA